MGHKIKFVVSDLHIGVGRAKNQSNTSQGFTAAADFVTFLRSLLRESERHQQEIELLINGDFFAFLQVPAVDDLRQLQTVYPVEFYQDSSQEASIKRLDIIAETNPEIFNALSDFIHVEAPQRHVTIIKGNHDVNLFWPGVKSRLREILGASGTRASLLRFADEFVSREKIYIEHGHQRAEKMNGYHDSFDPRALHNPTQIHYPPGSRFTIDFLNQAKQQWWFVDHVKPITTLIWYAFRWNFEFACRALASFIRHTPALVVSNFEMGNNLPASTEEFLNTLENPEQRQNLADQYAADTNFRLAFHRQVQQYLDDATVDNKGEANLPFINVSDDPVEMGQADQQRQQLMLKQAAQQIIEQEGAQVIIFGHTHAPSQEILDNSSLYINTGSWQQDFSGASAEMWQQLFAGTLGPNSIPRSFPYARIDYNDRDEPVARLLFFSRSSQTESTATTELTLNPKPSGLSKSL